MDGFEFYFFHFRRFWRPFLLNLPFKLPSDFVKDKDVEVEPHDQ